MSKSTMRDKQKARLIWENRALLVKSIVYRPYSEFVTFLIAWMVTGHLGISLTIGVANLFMKIFSYFIFDIFWNRFVKAKYKPCVIWLTGFSGSGKTTIANELCRKLKHKDVKCIILDGDEIRNAFKNTGFDRESRVQHNVNVGYMASLLEKQGYIVIVSLVSPYREARDKCRQIVSTFMEVHISTSLDICEHRDVKGLYKKARVGEIKQFTGIDDPYEEPLNAEVTIDTCSKEASECAGKILAHIPTDGVRN